MIGQAIERLKNPKNWWSWILFGWILCIIGYLFWHKVEPLGKVIAALGLLAIGITFVRLCVTRVIYAVLVGIAVVGYLFLYGVAVGSKKAVALKGERQGVYVQDKWEVTRKRPQFGKGAAAKAQHALFAPAFMTDTFLRAGKWAKAETAISRRDTTYLELKDGAKAQKKRLGK